MPIYEYQCGEGHIERWDLDVDERNTRRDHGCAACGSPLRRKFSFRQGLMIHEHFNESVGKPISSMRQFNDELKRANERNTARTGIEHKAEFVLPSDIAPGE